MFGINASEFLVIVLVLLALVGPKGLTQALKAFHKVVAWGRSVSAKLREESAVDLSGTGLEQLNIDRLDLRQYDPRQVIRQAVQEEMNAWIEQAQGKGVNVPDGPGKQTPESQPVESSGPAPSDETPDDKRPK